MRPGFAPTAVGLATFGQFLSYGDEFGEQSADRQVQSGLALGD